MLKLFNKKERIKYYILSGTGFQNYILIAWNLSVFFSVFLFFHSSNIAQDLSSQENVIVLKRIKKMN